MFQEIVPILSSIIPSGFALVKDMVAFLFVLLVIVFVHEMGHFLVARWTGVAVAVFSVGFGKELFGWTDAKGTRWRLSAIPLGGYVKFVGDMNPASMPDDEALAHYSEEERGSLFFFKKTSGPALP